MPTIDIDGRGATVKSAVQDLWLRFEPLQKQGYHSVTMVEIVETKTKRIVESFPLTEERLEEYLQESRSNPKSPKSKEQEHHVPRPHEYAFIARVRVEN